MPVTRANRRSAKGERLEARLTRAQKDLIARAAALRGSSVTEFVVSSAQQAASAALKEVQLLTLHDEARAVFVRAVLRPPAPTAAARAAARKYKRAMEK